MTALAPERPAVRAAAPAAAPPARPLLTGPFADRVVGLLFTLTVALFLLGLAAL